MENLYIGNIENGDACFYCNAKTGELIIKGRMLFVNSKETYKPINEWIKEYSKQPCQETICNVYVTYLGTSSSKWFLDILGHLQRYLLERGYLVKIVWHYEENDDDMMEQGEDYSNILKIPFELIET